MSAWSFAKWENGQYEMSVDDIMQDGMAVAEGAALRILPAQADAMPLSRQAREGESFGGGPIERSLAPRHGEPLLNCPLERFVQMETFGNSGEPREELDEPLGGDARGRIVVSRLVSPLKSPPNSRERFGRGSEIPAPSLLEGAFQLLETFLRDAVRLFAGHSVQLEKMIEITVPD